MARFAVHASVVELHERAAGAAVVHIDASQHKTFLILAGQGCEVFNGCGVFAAAELKAGKIDRTHLRGASAILPSMSPVRQRRHS
jgi:hypothetical protein